MPWFFVIALSIYLFMHLVIYLRVRCLLGPGKLRRVILWLAFLCLIATIPAAYYLRYNGQIELARAVMLTGYVWMGTGFLIFTFSIDSWVIQFIAWLIGRLRVRDSRSRPVRTCGGNRSVDDRYRSRHIQIPSRSLHVPVCLLQVQPACQ